MAQKDPRTVSGFSKNIVLPAGYVFFDEFDANGNPQGERLLSDTPGFTLAVSSESLEDYDADGPISELNFDHPTTVKRTATLNLKDMSADNFSTFIIGDKSTIIKGVASLTDTVVNGGNGVKQGYWYQLGITAGEPAGARAIQNAVIKVGTAKTILVDYEIDQDLARIYIVPGGGIADDDVVTADYDTTAVSWDQVASNSLGAKSGALRFVAHNSRGINRDLFLPAATLSPNGELAWKSRDTVQNMGFNVSVGLPTDGRAAVYLNGRAV